MTRFKNLYDVATIKLLQAISCCFVLSMAPGGAQADSFNNLDEASQRYVERICLPVQYTNGTDSYRECVEAQSDALSALGTNISTSLSFDDQYAIQQTCGASGDSGSSAFVDCVTSQINSLQGVAAPYLSPLAEDEVYALRQSCFAAQTSEGVRAYRECLNQSIADLESLPTPDFSVLSLLERNAVQLKCSSDTNQVVDYRNCLLDTLGQNSNTTQALSTAEAQSDDDARVQEASPATTADDNEPVASENDDTQDPAAAEQNNAAAANEPAEEQDFTAAVDTDPSGESSAAELASSPETSTDDDLATAVADNEPSGNEATQGEQAASATSSAATPTTSTEDGETANDQTAQPLQDAANDEATPDSTRIADNNAADDALSAADGAVDTTAPAQANEPNANPAGSFDYAKLRQELKLSIAQLSERVRAAADDLSEINQFVLFAALALPILLVACWQLLSGKKEQKQEMAVRRHSHSSSERGSEKRRRRSEQHSAPRQPQLTPAPTPVSTYTAEARWQSKLSDAPHYDLGGPATREIKHQPLRHSAPAIGGVPTQQLSNRTPAPDNSYDLWSDLPADRKTLTEWLVQHEPDEQLSLAIEFIIYWMAFGDERYEPELKRRIFTMESPNDHELIKRWVLKQDTLAFAEVVTWLQDSTTMKQGEQIITLLLALLVSENALTPAQNTLLRFLSDALGLGHERLGSIYRRAYGQPLPPLPRLDKPIWWDTQSTDQMKRWDARSVARQSLEIQFRVKLGLALSGEIDPEQIDEHFIRAVARCRPQRFDQLTHREQQLAKRQMAKFELARDSLAEISL